MMSISLFNRSVTHSANNASTRPAYPCSPARIGHRVTELRRAGAHGFSLVELMIGLLIVSLLLMLGMPTMQAFLRNSQIRNAAEAVSNGLQVARGEAIHRNVLVQFVLTPGTPARWDVNSVIGGQLVPVQSWSATEGSAATAVTPLDGNTMVTFNGLGRMVSPNPNGTASLAQVDVTTSQAGGSGTRPMRVVISPSGSVRMCDPDTHLPAGDPRSC